ncbi:hypothetical protein [Trinickia mobilis]|uniref:hypothetical protein n=1 Tax=Trinickia mobilis TaxID=2816356 RepID=UPI001A8F21F5|nr:hypothetical protein [Trinickia mobilis]
MPIEINDIPDLYKRYRWHNRHSLWGYDTDQFPSFEWISSLERRFARVVAVPPAETPVYLIREMIHWGGSQNGVLEKFELQLGSYDLGQAFWKVCSALDDTEAAIDAALDIPGMGLSYASKLLRFLRPETYGALDSQIRRYLASAQLEVPFRRVFDGNRNSMREGYKSFISILSNLKDRLETSQALRPGEDNKPLPWRAADIEMALFQLALEGGAGRSQDANDELER